jgi:carboxyl-terminal processing protease
MIRIFFGVSLILFALTAFLPKGYDILGHGEFIEEEKLQDVDSKEQILLSLMTSVLDRWHYQPQDINDTFSQKVFDTYLKYIDGSKRFLLKEEVEQLEDFKFHLDDQIEDGNLEFFNLSKDLITKSRSRARKITEDILSSPMNLQDEEYVEMDGDKRDYLETEEDLKDFWRRWLEHEVLQRYYTRVKKQEKRAENEEEFTPKPLDSLQIEAHEKVKEVFGKWFDRMDQRDDMDFYSTYLNVIANIFDPHTNFYKPRDKEDFDISMSGKLEGIGARLRSDGEETSVVSIVPGSPSWKQGDLEPKDVILEVAQGEEEPVDIAGMPIDEVVDLIRGEKGTEVRLTVRKLDGTILIIPIIRDVVILEEGFAKSMMLQPNNNESKVGYLKLPRFYADFDDRNGKSSAKDVKTELLKLKEEGADALIFDLRSNSGGSLRDVVKIAGYFVEEGPMVQVKDRNEDIELLKDKDRGEVIWDGPMVVMVNKFSASASEIFAAAMQDYNRAIIVGSPTTYGKGTVQRFIDLDRTIQGYDEFKPLGSVKYTIQTYYRINGGSTQLKGIESDIVLPDSWHYTTTGERELDFAIPWTQIDKAEYKQNVMDVSKFRKKLIKKSEERIKNDLEFSEILQDAERLQIEQEKTRKPIQIDAFFEMKNKDKQESDAFDSLFKKLNTFSSFNLQADLEFIEEDSSRIERNQEWRESVQEDIYLEEALHILGDMQEMI